MIVRLRVRTTMGTVEIAVKSGLDAARILMDFQRMGMTCKWWEVVK